MFGLSIKKPKENFKIAGLIEFNTVSIELLEVFNSLRK